MEKRKYYVDKRKVLNVFSLITAKSKQKSINLEGFESEFLISIDNDVAAGDNVYILTKSEALAEQYYILTEDEYLKIEDKLIDYAADEKKKIYDIKLDFRQMVEEAILNEQKKGD